MFFSGFLTQLIHLDNELRLEREHCRPRKLSLSTLNDRHRLPLSWHNEFWMPNQGSIESVLTPTLSLSTNLPSLYLPNLSPLRGECEQAMCYKLGVLKLLLMCG